MAQHTVLCVLPGLQNQNGSYRRKKLRKIAPLTEFGFTKGNTRVLNVVW